MAQCLHEGETLAVLLRKNRPVRRRAVAGRALYHQNFYLGGADRGALKTGKRYIWGALYPGKTSIPLMGFAQGTEGKER